MAYAIARTGSVLPSTTLGSVIVLDVGYAGSLNEVPAGVDLRRVEVNVDAMDSSDQMRAKMVDAVLADAASAGYSLLEQNLTLPFLDKSDLHPHTNLDAGVAFDSGVVPVEHLGTGTPTEETFLRGDGAWAVPPRPLLSMLGVPWVTWMEVPVTSGIVVDLPPGRTYRIDGFGLYQCTDKAGMVLQLGGQAVQTMCAYNLSAWKGEGAKFSSASFQGLGGRLEVPRLDNANTDYHFEITGVVATGPSGGLLSVNVATIKAGASVTVHPTSYLRAQPMI